MDESDERDTMPHRPSKRGAVATVVLATSKQAPATDVPRPLITEPIDGVREVRGFELLNSLAFARSLGGRTGLVGALRRLGPTDLETLTGSGAEGDGRIRKLKWYPFGLHCRLMRAVDAEFGEGDLSLLFRLGEFMAERDLPAMFRSLVKLGHPGWIIDAGTLLWRVFHREGSWKLDRSAGELIARLEGLTESDEAYCATFQGWISRGMELSGASDLRVYHPVCQARGGNQCVFTGRWSARGTRERTKNLMPPEHEP